MQQDQDIGVVGMAVMGRNIALNMANHGYRVAIYNRSSQKTEEVIAQQPAANLLPCYTPAIFIAALRAPRKILLMVQAGDATDKTIAALLPYLSPGDLLIDGGNAYYSDTERRTAALASYKIKFLGVGISGGEEGALAGPAMMPGGDKDAYALVEDIFQTIAAKAENRPCVSYIGAGGAGHYVKMVHNGIEYGDMQLISEAYWLLKHVLQYDNTTLSNLFTHWNEGELNSYLIEITASILGKKSGTGEDLIDLILDQAENKGTGKWTSQSALDLGEPLTLITASVFARYLSTQKAERAIAATHLVGPTYCISMSDKREFEEKVRQALYLGKILSYAQGFQQLRAAAEHHQWQLNYAEIAQIFRAGCIIRAQFLHFIAAAFMQQPNLSHLLFAPYFKQVAIQYQQALREVVSYAVQAGIAVPALSSAITYYDGFRAENSPANLLQAQRDYFGAHTYRRIDKEGVFHTEWVEREE